MGRKILLLVSIVAHIIILLLILLISSYIRSLLYLYMFLLGLKAPLTEQVSYVLLSELTPTNQREGFSSLLRTIDAASSLLVVGIFAVSHNWRTLFLFTLIECGVLLILIALLVPRSPLLYASQGNYERARAIYERIANLTRQ